MVSELRDILRGFHTGEIKNTHPLGGEFGAACRE